MITVYCGQKMMGLIFYTLSMGNVFIQNILSVIVPISFVRSKFGFSG